MRDTLNYLFIFIMALFFGANVHASDLSTMICKISSIVNTEIISNQSKYEQDIKYDFQFEHENQIVSVTVGVIRPEHQSLLLKKPLKDISRAEVVDNAHLEYGRVWQKELLYNIRLIYTQNSNWNENKTKLTFWTAELPNVTNYKNLIGFWSMATDEELITITLVASPISDKYYILPADMAIDIVNQVIAQCQIKSLSNKV